MARLMLSLLGSFQVMLDGEPVTRFDSNKVRALLAYLAVEAGRPHRRDVLAGLLWPDWPDRSARTNLRNALANLRKAVGDQDAAPPHLSITRETLQFNLASDYWLDVTAFRALVDVEHADAARLQEATTLYRGPFLEGFSVGDSAAYEDWALQVREQLQVQVLAALRQLSVECEARGEVERAIEFTRRQVGLAPWQEEAHQRLMRLLALNGARSTALAQYEICRRLLKEELDVEPSAETRRLYERIRDGAVHAAPVAVRPEARLAHLPTGTVTFLFTDIQGSTPLWEQKPQAMKASVAQHHALLRQAIEANGGTVFKIIGDEFQAAFDLASQGLSAALAGQHALLAQDWGETGPLRVRMGLHTGPAQVVGGDGDARADYAVSHTLNRAARIMSTGHGGQILLSREAADLVRRELPPGVTLTDLGEHYLKGLAFPEQLFQVVASDLPQDFPSLVTVDRPRHNLPAQLIPFVGREPVLARIEQRLHDPGCRLLTLVGPGGSGKTRLALEAAARQIDHYPHGIFFVSLAPLDAVETIVPAIAQSLGFTFHGEEEPKEQLLSYLREKSVLLVLDNAEHLLREHVADVASIATDILRAAPQVVILVTSRVGLHVQGEHRFPVEGMNVPTLSPLAAPTSSRYPSGRTGPGPIPGGEPQPYGREELDDAAQYSAIKLFVQSARRAQPDFALSAEILADVVRICLLVESMPLGILLAAAWVALFAPGEIADEIAAQLPGHGFDFLESDLRDVPDRQRSLRAAFDYSWNLLTGQDREMFAALSVFRGGFTREAAQDVTGVSLRGLMALADKSLLHRTPGGRYEVHELVRQYAAEKLAASPDAEQQVRDRHCATYAAALQRWDEALKGPRQLAALTEIEADLGNARAAWEWAVERGLVRDLDRAMGGLCRFYEWRGRYEEGDAACRAVEGASALGEKARPAPPEQMSVHRADASAAERVRAKATAWRGVFSRALRRLEQAQRLLEESLASLAELASGGQDIRREKAFALWQLGYTLYDLGGGEDVRQRYEDSLTLYRALGDRWGTATVLCRLGDLLQQTGDFGKAEASARESLAIQQDLGDYRGVAGSLRILGLTAMNTGRLEECERLIRKSVAAFRAAGDRVHAAEALINLGSDLQLLGKLTQAHSCLEESVAIYRDLGFGGHGSSLSLLVLGSVDTALGRYQEARASAQAALALARERGYRLGIGNAFLLLGRLAIVEGEYVQAQQLFQQSCSILEGSAMYAWVLSGLGFVARGLGQPDRARQHLCKALLLASEVGDLVATLLALGSIALLLVDEGQVERAVELYALVDSRFPYVANAQWAEDVAGRHIAAAAKALPPDVVAAAQERGRARDLEATVKELLAELEAEMYDGDSTAED
jgi:DNA-binding SARP family transcriptional activator/predicted ATPase